MCLRSEHVICDRTRCWCHETGYISIRDMNASQTSFAPRLVITFIIICLEFGRLQRTKAANSCNWVCQFKHNLNEFWRKCRKCEKHSLKLEMCANADLCVSNSQMKLVIFASDSDSDYVFNWDFVKTQMCRASVSIVETNVGCCFSWLRRVWANVNTSTTSVPLKSGLHYSS